MAALRGLQEAPYVATSPVVVGWPSPPSLPWQGSDGPYPAMPGAEVGEAGFGECRPTPRRWWAAVGGLFRGAADSQGSGHVSAMTRGHVAMALLGSGDRRGLQRTQSNGDACGMARRVGGGPSS